LPAELPGAMLFAFAPMRPVMQLLNADQIHALAPMPLLIAALREAFAQGCLAPARQVAPIPGAGQRLFLSMPAFDDRGRGAVKLTTVVADNPARGLPSVQAAIVVFSEHGTPIAVLDGTLVTRLRTGAASALASSFLSREDSASLLIMGSGALVPYMALAHCAVRPIRRVCVWGRQPQRAAQAAAATRALLAGGVQVEVAGAADEAVAASDIVCCATSSTTPVLLGEWLASGAHVDLVGSFTPDTREADDAAVRGARIFVDTFAGALSEAGDLLGPLARGVINSTQVEGELSDLVRARVRGRRTREEITLFKSVGTALEDLAAAQLIVAAAGG
jgi:ornithine cyclodeaminase